MFFHILQRDLKRKKTMNIILLLFIILAAMFVASGINNVITVISGTDYYLDKAGIGDLNYITAGDDSTGHLKDFLEKSDAVSKFRIESVILGTKDNVKLLNGKIARVNSNFSCFFLRMSDAKLNYYNMNNQKVKHVAVGHLYVSGRFMEKNHLKNGDKIIISHNSFKKEFIIDGGLKDALLGSGYGNPRFFISDKDYSDMLEDKNISAHYRGEIAFVNLKKGAKLTNISKYVPEILFDGTKSTIKMTYVMDTIVSFMILILSICLILVSFVVLRFSINFTIQEEFREIGVMKAIGLKNRQVRGLYIIKYLVLSIAGASIGFILSIPFSKELIKSVSDNMYFGNSLGVMTNAAGAVMTVIVIVAFAYICTGRLNHATPIDAIRNGQTGERYKKKTIYRIKKSHVNNNLYMALNDIVSNPKRFTTIIISFFICTLLVFLVVNTEETMDSPNLISMLTTKSDIYVNQLSTSMDYMNAHTKDEFKEYLDGYAEKMKKLGMPAKCYSKVFYKYSITFNKEEYNYTCSQGVNIKNCEDSYIKGKAPVSKNEIAITPQISKETGAKIGDVINIDFGTQKLDCTVVAYFQSFNQLGEIIELYEDAPTDFKYATNIMQIQFTFTDNPDQKEIDKRRDKLKTYLGNDEIWNAREYCVNTIGVVSILKMVHYLICATTLVVVILVTILIEFSFITDEKSQIAILKAIGFKNKDVIKWHVYRFGVISLAAVILAAVLSIPATKLCITPIFGMMGAEKIKYNIVAWKVFGLYPGIIVVITIIVALITAQYTRTITSRDTADIE